MSLFRGRIRRRTFWLWFFGLLIPVIAIILLLDDAASETTKFIIFWASYLPLLFVIGIRRLHDMGKQELYLILIIIPLLNLILLGALLFWPGTVGPNKYGPDPRDSETNRTPV